MCIELMTQFWKMEDGSTLLCLCLSPHIIFNLPLCKHDYRRLFFFKQILIFILLSVHLFIQTVFVCAGVDTVFLYV